MVVGSHRTSKVAEEECNCMVYKWECMHFGSKKKTNWKKKKTAVKETCGMEGKCAKVGRVWRLHAHAGEEVSVMTMEKMHAYN